MISTAIKLMPTELKYDYTELDKFLQMVDGPKGMVRDINRLQYALAGILSQVVSYNYANGEKKFYLNDATTDGIYQVMELCEILLEMQEWQ